MANTKVQSEQIEDGSITADKLADGTIVAAELADNAVETAAINADAVTGAKIADNAIDSEHYTDGSIDTAHIADAQITVAKMAANSVDSDQYVDGSIDTVHLGDLQVTTAKIANGNISTAKIADNAVTSAKIDTNIDIAGTFDVTGATTLDSTATVAGNLVVGGTNVDAAGTVSLKSDGNIRAVGAASTAYDTIIGAISGVSNGFHIVQDSSNNQTYTFYNGGNPSLTIDSTGDLVLKGNGGDDALNIVHSGNTVKIVSIGQSSDNSGNGVIQLRRNNGTVHSQIHSHGTSYFNGGSIGVGFASGTPDKLIEARGAGGSGGALVRLTQTDGSGASGPSIDFGYSGQTWRVGANIHQNTDFTIQDTSGNSKMLRLDPDGNLALGSPNAHINDSGGTQPLYLTMHRDAGNLIELAADHASSEELIGGIDFTNDNNADAANNDGDGKLVATMRARSYTDDSNASDDSGGYIQFATKTHGDLLAERMRIDQNGEIQVKGQRNSSGNSQFAFKTVYYQFDMDSGGTHYLEVPLYSAYSSSKSSGWAEMDIAWFPDHASHTHLHSYKFMWGSDHTRILNVGVISATANETTASYGPYNITSTSQLYRHPTAGDNNMTYLYIKLTGYHSVNKRRVITLRGVASADANTASLGPIIDHGSTVPVANMVSVNSEIQSA